MKQKNIKLNNKYITLPVLLWKNSTKNLADSFVQLDRL